MRRRNKLIIVIMVLLFGMLTFISWLKPADEYSDTERRTLAKLPKISVSNILSGDFMDDFEGYAADQFPFREKFRRVKALFSTKVLGQKDNNDIYVVDGHISKMEYPFNEASVKRVTERFRYIYEKYMAGTGAKVYLSIIPDKNYYLAEENGYLAMDYEKLIQMMLEKTEYMEYIDIVDLLSIEDYYRTDLHWKQEQIVDVAKRLASELDIKVSGNYEIQTLETSFYGTYYGQAALDVEPDEIKYLTNDMLNQCTVYDYENDKTLGIYDMEKAEGKDPYEMYLSGPLSLLTIENPNGPTDRELIVFRDSFGSSLVPLLTEGYSKVTLVDIRYLHPDLLGKYIEFRDQDVLFLYGTQILNNGETIK